MHFGFALDLSDIDLLNIELLDQWTHLDLLDTDIPSKHFVCFQDVLKTLQDMSSRRLQNMSSRHLQDMSSKRLQDMSWRRLEEVFSVTIYRLPRRLARCLQDVFKTSWKKKNCYAEDVLKTSWRPTKVCWEHSLYSREFISLFFEVYFQMMK